MIRESSVCFLVRIVVFTHSNYFLCSLKQSNTSPGTMSGHRGDVTTLSFDHSGKFLLSGARDNTIMLWSVENRNRVRQIHDARGAAGTSTHAGDISRIKIIPGSDNQVFSLTSSLDSNVIVMSLGEDVAKSQPMEDSETKEDENGRETKRQDRDVISMLTEDDKMTDATATGLKEISDKLMYRQFVRSHVLSSNI